jgi:hypothetical protein
MGIESEVIAKKGVARKALLLMFVNVRLLAFTPVMVRPGSSPFKCDLAPMHAAASAAQAASFKSP